MFNFRGANKKPVEPVEDVNSTAQYYASAYLDRVMNAFDVLNEVMSSLTNDDIKQRCPTDCVGATSIVINENFSFRFLFSKDSESPIAAKITYYNRELEVGDKIELFDLWAYESEFKPDFPVVAEVIDKKNGMPIVCIDGKEFDVYGREDYRIINDRTERTGWDKNEREQTISALRNICSTYGDNDWDDDLHLADVIAKHLHRNLNDK